MSSVLAPPRPAHLVLAALYLRHGHVSKHLVPALGPPRPRPRLQRVVGLGGKLPGVEPLAPAVRAAHKLDTGLQGNRIHLEVDDKFSNIDTLLSILSNVLVFTHRHPDADHGLAIHRVVSLVMVPRCLLLRAWVGSE